MKLKTVTLGCKVNQYETEYVREGLLSIGYQDALEGEAAELCVINTCTVTNEGDAKSRQTIRRLARRNPGAKIVVMGCYATRAPSEVAALPGVSQVVTDKRELPDLLGRFGVTDLPTGISGFGRRHRAYVKVQDGCLLRCSFCIIPYVRPHVTSRPVAHILDEIRRLVDNPRGMAESKSDPAPERGIHLLTISGIRIIIDYSWFLIFLLVVVSLATGYLPQESPGASPLAYWGAGLVATVAFFLSILFHELAHSTGHASRLSRKGITDPVRFASHEYSREELVAEMGSAFLAGHCGIEPVTLADSAAYLSSWISVLRGDDRLVVQAAASAQRAADFILDRRFDEAQDTSASAEVA